MSLLSHFFADDMTRAEELARDGPLLAASVKRYLASFTDKYASEEDLRKGAKSDDYSPG